MMMNAMELIMTILLALLLIVSLVKFGSNRRNLPPGPWKLPLIGNIHQLTGDFPHRTFRNLAKKYGPLMHLQIGELSFVVVSSPEIAKQVLDTHDAVFVSRAETIATKIISYDSKDVVFSPCGDYWRRIRRICNTKLLGPKNIQESRPIRVEQTTNLIRWIASNEGQSINLTEKVYSLLYTTTSIAAFGKKNEEQELFQNLVRQMGKLFVQVNIFDIYPCIKFLQYWFNGLKTSLERTHLKIDQILQKIINDHRTLKAGDENSTDFVDVILKHGDENDEFHLADENIKALWLDIFTGGSETVATTIDWAMIEFMKHPNILKRAQEEVREVYGSDGYVNENKINELKYVSAIIKETLRFHPPGPLLPPRINSQKLKINGYVIPANTIFIVNAWALHRDPAYWQDAEYFKPERFLDSSVNFKGKYFEYIPFGAGRRICPGAEYAYVNVLLAISQFLYHFDWELPRGMKCEDLNMKEQLGASVRRKDDLYMIPTIRNPLP